MNSSGWIRGMMAKQMESDAFVLQVIETIERQLLLWDANSSIQILKEMTDSDVYFIRIYHTEQFIDIWLTTSEVSSLQDAGPYALDQYIWKELCKQGLKLGKTDGNYIKYCAVS